MEVKLVPWDYDFTQEAYDGLFISNGPGDPSLAQVTISHLRKVSGCTYCLFWSSGCLDLLVDLQLLIISLQGKLS